MFNSLRLLFCRGFCFRQAGIYFRQHLIADGAQSFQRYRFVAEVADDGAVGGFFGEFAVIEIFASAEIYHFQGHGNGDILADGEKRHFIADNKGLYFQANTVVNMNPPFLEN